MTTKKRQKSAKLNLFIRPELKAAFMAAADKAGCSATSLFERLATEHCRKAGTLIENGNGNGNGKPAKAKKAKGK